MWELFFLRPDAVTALEDETVQKILPRYIKVVRDELPANFQILKKIEFKPKKNLTNQQLWKIHDELMKDFYILKKKLDEFKVEIDDLKTPRFSLLDLKIHLVKEIMKSCELCEWKCGVNRLKGELGFCKVGNECIISSEHIHYGEESYYVPSFTIFYWSCTFSCQYCQNYTISQRLEPGIVVTSEHLAKRIETRREEGCRNVNFVGGSPTPHILWILQTLKHCRVNIPTLWNSNMYMSEKSMKILGGIVDVYLTDLKYGNSRCGLRLSKVPKYWEVVTRNHLIAMRQTEMTIRHLILPNHVECCSFPILEWIAENIKDKCIVNVMDQYYPCFKAIEYPDINRRITREEYQRVLEKARELELNVLD